MVDLNVDQNFYLVGFFVVFVLFFFCFFGQLISYSVSFCFALTAILVVIS